MFIPTVLPGINRAMGTHRKNKSRRAPRVAHSFGAAVIGTAAMTGYQLAVTKARGGSLRQRIPRTWKEAPAPARVAKEIAEAAGHGSWLTKRRVPATVDAVHWAYGIGWGTVYGAIVGRRRAESIAGATALGVGLWSLSYAALAPAGIYEPPWRYPAKELALDLSYHLVYAGAVAGALRALDH